MVIHFVPAVLCVTLAGCSVPGIVTFEPAGSSATSGGAAAKVDPKAYADSIWASKVLPTVAEKAVDAATLLAAIKADPSAAATKYGVASVSGGAPTYMIKGTGKVTKRDTSDPLGPLTIDLGKGATVKVATGPVLTGTALRDAAGVAFGEFTNQIDFQNVGTALNTKAKTLVIAKVDLATIEGKTVSFAGAFAASSAEGIVVVPTELKAS